MAEIHTEQKMRIHWLQHVPFEGLGSIAGWAAQNGCPISGSRMFAGDALPPVSTFDMLIVMGGPMSANDDAVHSWLAGEKRFIKQAMDAGKRVLGICLGAQLVAAVAGARIRPNAHKEIGWFPVEKVEAADQSAAGRVLAQKTVGFHWHGETFDIPPGAAHLARSQGCENQAFALGDRTVGLQFHLEATAQSAEALIEHCRHELVDAPYIQTEGEIRSQFARCFDMNRAMDRLLDYFLAM
jgi:GMP synthase-like glutamine amidotransferase